MIGIASMHMHTCIVLCVHVENVKVCFMCDRHFAAAVYKMRTHIDEAGVDPHKIIICTWPKAYCTNSCFLPI